MTSITVVDTIEKKGKRATSQLSDGSSGSLLDATDFETAIIKAVQDDPFVTITELKRMLRITGQFAGVGWWSVFNVLRRKRLLRRRSRFRFARKG